MEQKPRLRGGDLDRKAVELFEDDDALDRVVGAIRLERGIGYLAALDRLHSALEYAPGCTVRQLLELDQAPDDVELQVAILDRVRLGESYEVARRFVLASAGLNQRVRDRLKQLGRPESEYPRTLEEILAEDRDADMGVIRGPLFPVSDPGRQA